MRLLRARPAVTPGGVVSRLDLRPFMAAMAAMAEALGRTSRTIWEGFTPEGRLAVKRDRIGGNGRDARREPGTYLTAHCAAWLCISEPCPSDAHGLGCTCRCHRRRQP
jgi:hypothetical protein